MEQPMINDAAIGVAAVAQFLLGGLWYSPVLFGKKWMALTGITEEKAKEMNPAKMYGLTFIASLVAVYVLAHFVSYTHAETIGQGLQTGFWIWLGFVATIMFVNTMYHGKSMQLYVIDGAYQLLNLLIAGAILAVWK